MAKAIFDEAGVTAIPLSVPDVLVGLQTGMVDVVYTPPTERLPSSGSRRVKYLTDIPLAYLAGGSSSQKTLFKRCPRLSRVSSWKPANVISIS